MYYLRISTLNSKFSNQLQFNCDLHHSNKSYFFKIFDKYNKADKNTSQFLNFINILVHKKFCGRMIFKISCSALNDLRLKLSLWKTWLFQVHSIQTISLFEIIILKIIFRIIKDKLFGKRNRTYLNYLFNQKNNIFIFLYE